MFYLAVFVFFLYVYCRNIPIAFDGKAVGIFFCFGAYWIMLKKNRQFLGGYCAVFGELMC